MNCHIATFRKPALRALISRVVGVFLVLQALIPGVLAYSAAEDGLWCRSVATAVPSGTSPSAGLEPCLVCVVMASGNAPLPATAPEFPAPVVAAAAVIPCNAALSLPQHAAGSSPPIRAPPAVAIAQTGFRPASGIGGCALT